MVYFYFSQYLVSGNLCSVIGVCQLMYNLEMVCFRKLCASVNGVRRGAGVRLTEAHRSDLRPAKPNPTRLCVPVRTNNEYEAVHAQIVCIR